MTDPRQLAVAFVTAVHAAAGERLEAAAMFGSAARGEWIEGVSDVNVLVLLDDIDAPLLARLAPVARAALPRGVRPLVMERGEWRRAEDVFSIELADMKDAHSPLFGDDPTTGLMPQPAALRIQAESELRSKLLHLHAGMMMVEDEARLGQLFVHALPSFVTYLRAALRLAQQTVPQNMRDVITAGCTLAGTTPDAFLSVLEARRSGAPFTVTLTDAVADNFNSSAERIAAFVDAFGR
ncbi:MAG TPA: nucleotidyltransferase domain-containing protein [Longimicrobiales bacterium]|nr:nucleotidyltransferase domain-containing protein [Longimicrobiales bacterium]